MKTAMILAAGRGERLRPLTWEKPKCLTDIHSLPLLGIHLKHLADSGFHKIVVNHAYLGSLIRDYVKNFHSQGMEVLLSPEPVGGLETGGGIRNALPLLGDEPFVAVNADIVTDFDYACLPSISPEKAHIVLVEKNQMPGKGDFDLSPSGLASNNPKRYTYAGIACYHPAMFYQHPIGRYSVTPILRQLADNHCLTAQLHKGKWMDIGCLQGLKAAQTMMLKSNDRC
ncbi:nucleotidyltransferase family protein [Legionella sp. W05-934-2]|jgi:MurNAc alpha-1-phosphate uridylyltransferase|uniref:nucleotidyltransferase family protein n=1 Tax=Legionella sp. W05-934-2 TaxID=1198649 RepID=UPI00346194D0